MLVDARFVDRRLAARRETLAVRSGTESHWEPSDPVTIA